MMGRWTIWATSPRPITPTRSLFNCRAFPWVVEVLQPSHGGPGGLGARRALHRVEDPLDLEAVGEGRRGRVPGRHVADEVGDLVDERVLVAQAMARRPPGARVRMVRLGHQDAAEPRARRRRGPVVDMELVHRLEV